MTEHDRIDGLDRRADALALRTGKPHIYKAACIWWVSVCAPWERTALPNGMPKRAATAAADKHAHVLNKGDF